jgi:hypothetical protein
MKYTYIPIGVNCHPAMNLNMLNLRKMSLPFDWLLINSLNIFEYINDLIRTDFINFTKKLEYNHRNKVISQYYPYTEFFHHDLIKNTSDKPEMNNSNINNNLIDTMNRRGKRFMDIITDEKLDVIFLNTMMYDVFKNLDHDKLYNDMYQFENNCKIKCKFTILVYMMNDNNDFEMNIPPKYNYLKHFIFKKYVRNTKVSKYYGKLSDFRKILIT